MIERAQKKELLARMRAKRSFIQVVAGARQIGKSTMIQQTLAQIKQPHISASADGVSNSSWLDQQWETARITLQTERCKYVILAIDEIQKIHNWSETVKKNWDADTKNQLDIRVVLSGNSKLLLQEGLTESLAGRFEMIKMPHWTFSEMQEAFNFNEEQFAFYGGYPGAASLINSAARWRTYVKDSLIETTISKDILMLNRVDKPALLKQLFELASSYSTQELSYNKLIGQLQNAGNTTTLTHYINLLNSAHLLTGLNKFSGSQVMQRNSTPKFQVYNNAYFTTSNAYTFKQASTQPALWGRWVENIIGCHLVNTAMLYDMQLNYWRNGNHEVDFILTHENKSIAIEVKSGHRLKNSGIGQLQQTHRMHRTILIGSDGLDWKKFIKLDLRKLF
ncbi:MAG: hypothetical protein RL660_490 [Bacteroidota bacterium]